MLAKLYGIIDLSAGIAMLLIKLWSSNAVNTIAIVLAFCLIVKALIYIKDIASIVDLAASVFLILASFGFYPAFSYVFVLWLIQKGVVSLFFS